MHTHTLVHIPVAHMHAHCPYLSLALSASLMQTPRHEDTVLFKAAPKLVSHSGRGKLHPQINTLMEFHSFITHPTLQSVALQGEGKRVSGKTLPVYMLFYITEVQQINIAELSQEAGSECDALSLINAIDCSLCTGNLKTEKLL